MLFEFDRPSQSLGLQMSFRYLDIATHTLVLGVCLSTIDTQCERVSSTPIVFSFFMPCGDQFRENDTGKENKIGR